MRPKCCTILVRVRRGRQRHLRQRCNRPLSDRVRPETPSITTSCTLHGIPDVLLLGALHATARTRWSTPTSAAAIDAAISPYASSHDRGNSRPYGPRRRSSASQRRPPSRFKFELRHRARHLGKPVISRLVSSSTPTNSSPEWCLRSKLSGLRKTAGAPHALRRKRGHRNRPRSHHPLPGRSAAGCGRALSHGERIPSYLARARSRSQSRHVVEMVEASAPNKAQELAINGDSSVVMPALRWRRRPARSSRGLCRKATPLPRASRCYA